MSEQVKLIVERRWTDDHDEPVCFQEAESGWIDAEDFNGYSDASLGQLLTELAARTEVDPE